MPAHLNSTDKRRLKSYLLQPLAGFDGNGSVVPCFWCKKSLDYASLTCDRWPIPGCQGGSYRSANVVPACQPCNNHRRVSKVIPLPKELPRTFSKAKPLMGWKASRR